MSTSNPFPLIESVVWKPKIREILILILTNVQHIYLQMIKGSGKLGIMIKEADILGTNRKSPEMHRRLKT
jgi:hypothetical protein